MVVLVLLVIFNSFNSVTSFYAFTAIRATVFSSLYCETNINDLGRSEVQALAKQHKIRANLKTSEILAQLNKLGITSAAPVSEPSSKEIREKEQDQAEADTTADAVVSIHDRALEALNIQGIDFSDILKLQKKITKSTTLKPIGKDISAATIRNPKRLLDTSLPSQPLLLSIPKISSPLSQSSASASSSSSSASVKEDVLVLLEDELINSSSRRKKMKTSPPKEDASPITDISPVKADRNPRKVTKTEPADTVSLTATENPKTKRSSAPITADVNLTGVTLSAMMTDLVSSIGFDALYEETNLRCFKVKPTLRSSLKILRQEDMVWARKKVEYLYIKSVKNGVISATSTTAKAKVKANAIIVEATS